MSFVGFPHHACPSGRDEDIFVGFGVKRAGIFLNTPILHIGDPLWSCAIANYFVAGNRRMPSNPVVNKAHMAGCDIVEQENDFVEDVEAAAAFMKQEIHIHAIVAVFGQDHQDFLHEGICSGRVGGLARRGLGVETHSFIFTPSITLNRLHFVEAVGTTGCRRPSLDKWVEAIRCVRRGVGDEV